LTLMKSDLHQTTPTHQKTSCGMLPDIERVSDVATPQHEEDCAIYLLDLETTGTDGTKENRIIEISALIHWKGQNRTFSSYVNPEDSPITIYSRAIHGLTLEDVANAPSWQTVWTDFLVWLQQFRSKKTKILAHNG